jgi:hypothetical protein
MTCALQHPAFLLKNNIFPSGLLIRVMHQYDFHRGLVRAIALIAIASVDAQPPKAFFEDETGQPSIVRNAIAEGEPSQVRAAGMGSFETGEGSSLAARSFLTSEDP